MYTKTKLLNFLKSNFIFVTFLTLLTIYQKILKIFEYICNYF